MDNKEVINVRVKLLVDRDVYPLPIDGQYSEEMRDLFEDLLYDVDGVEMKGIKVS